MTAYISLTGGQSIEAYLTSSGGVAFDELDGALAPVALGTQVAPAGALWVNAQARADGGFTVEWALPGAVMAQDFDAAGAATDQAHADASPAAPALMGFASTGQGQILDLPAGGYVTGTQYAPYVAAGIIGSPYLRVQQFGVDGAPVGPTWATNDTAHFGVDSQVKITSLAGGGYAAAWDLSLGFGIEFSPKVQLFSSSGVPLLSSPIELPASFQSGPYAIAGLADGGFVIAWTASVTDGQGHLAQELMTQEYAASGTMVGTAQSLGATDGGTPAIDALPDGRYVISWSNTGGAQHTVLSEAGAALGLPNPPNPGSALEALVPSGSAVTLSGSAGWTSAAVLSDHDLAVADTTTASWGGPQGHVQVYDASASQVGSTTLQEFADAGQSLTPIITALQGGFYEISYAGAPGAAGLNDYEIYDSHDQLVFEHNAFTAPTRAFAPLLNGGYVVTNSATSVFGLVDAQGNASWLGVPADAPSGSAPLVEGLQGGGFVFNYAGSSHYDVFDASGRQLGQGDLGASTSGYATGFAATAGGGSAEAWLSPDGGQDGLPTSLDVQTFDASGKAKSAALTLTQDLDPWHTDIRLQAHADGSVAVLWSQGGAIWGAEIGADGSAGPAHFTGALGSLSDAQAVQLSNGGVGLVFVQGGEIWADLFDPATGASHATELGASVGDVHAVATAAGGMAVSWHDGLDAILGSVINAAGQAGPPIVLPGDLVGVDSNGAALVLGHALGGTPVLQHYALNDGGLFWTG